MGKDDITEKIKWIKSRLDNSSLPGFAEAKLKAELEELEKRPKKPISGRRFGRVSRAPGILPAKDSLEGV